MRALHKLAGIVALQAWGSSDVVDAVTVSCEIAALIADLERERVECLR